MKTMREVLTACTDEQIAAIMRLWAMPDEPGLGSTRRVEALLQRMRDPIAARFVWEYLSDDECQVLYRAIAPSVRYGVHHDALIKKTQFSPARYETAVNKLIQYALLQEYEMPTQRVIFSIGSSKRSKNTVETVKVLSVFNENLETLYPVGREFFAGGDCSRMDLDRLLSTLPEGDLYKIMQHYTMQWGVYYSRADFREMIIDKLLDMEEPLDYIINLDERAQRLFLWLREHDGRASVQDARDYMQLNDATLLETLHTLAQCALVFDTFSNRTHILFVPNDLYSNMRTVGDKARAEQAKARLVEYDSIPPAVRDSENIVLYDLAALVGAVYQQTIEPTQAGRVPKRIAAKIRPLLRGQARVNYDNEDDYLEILLDAAQQLKFLQLSKSPLQDAKPFYEVRSDVGQWGHLSIHEQTRQLLLYWLANYSWRDVYGVNYVSWSTYSWDASEGRKALLRQLDKCVSGRWYTIDSLLKAIWDEEPFAFRPTSTYYRQTKLRKNSDTRAKWERCEGEVYKGILASTLYELGIVTLGYKNANALTENKAVNPDFFILTELGGSVMVDEAELHSTKEPEAQSPQRVLVVQPNFELMLLQPDMPTIYDLLPFAQVNQIGVVSRLTLTKASVLRGMRVGKTLEQILTILQERGQKDIPQNVSYTLHDWTKNYKDVRISQVLLLELSSEEAGQTLSTFPALQGLEIRQLAPRIFAVKGDVDLQALRKQLDKEGIMVQINGEIFTRPKVPSHYVTFGMYR